MTAKLEAKDFATSQEVRWCPGCGDYAILKVVTKILAEVGATRESTVFVSGIGCSSRFPYYIESYGFHTIHGRAPAFATGLNRHSGLVIRLSLTLFFKMQSIVAALSRSQLEPTHRS